MSDGLILEGPSENFDVFECPNCKETIDTSATVCRFCGAKIDHQEAQNAAHLLAKVDEACSDASVLQGFAVTAFCLGVGVVIGILRNPRFIARVGFQNVVLGYCVLVLILSSPFPVWSLNWWRKYDKLSLDDEDFQNDRRMVRTMGSAAFAFMIAFAALFCLMLILKMTYR